MLGALGKIGVVSNGVPLPRRVRAILNKYGATMLLPGVSGAMRFGYQPGNYRESTGQTLAAADQQVGLVVDAARSPGPELVTNGDFSNGTTGWTAISATVSAASGRLVLTSTVQSGGGALQAYADITTVVGKSYLLSGSYIEQSGIASPSPRFRAMTTGSSLIAETRVLSNNSVGTLVFTATATTTRIVFRCDASSLTTSSTISIDNISVRELPGIHASQSTSGFQPVLRNTSGIQSWQFDGIDDRLSLSAVPFQMADDHFVVVGATAGSLTNDIDLFAQRSSAAINPILLMRVAATTGAVQAIYRDDAGTLVTIQSAGGATVGTPFVGAMRQVSGVRNTWRDLSTGTNNSTSLGATTFNTAAIGASLKSTPIGFHSGHIHGIIIGKGAITDSELLTLERFVASLQGRTL